MLGVQKVIWLPGDVMDTETDGHVDGFLAYVKPATVLCEVVADPADPRYPIMAENRRVLERETDARGRRFELLPIAEAPRSGVPEGDLPLLCQLLHRQWRRHRAGLRHRGGCIGRGGHIAARLSGPSDRAGGSQGFVPRRRRHPLHYTTRTRRIALNPDREPKETLPCAQCRSPRFSSAAAGIGSRISPPPIDWFARRQQRGAQVVLIPELFETPYFCAVQRSRFYDLARPLRGHPTVAHFRRVAADLGSVIPVSIYERSGMALFNSVVVIDADGTVAGHYRKSHIPQAPGYEEKYYFSPGDTGFKPIATAYGKLGIAICWDQWFPEAARALVLQGADFLMYPTAIGSEPNASGR